MVERLHVIPDTTQPHRGLLRCGDLAFPCTLGHGGVRADKREGDGATPSGTFAVRRVFYRADRIAAPATKLATTAIARDDGWCDASGDAQYNKPVKLPYPASAENLWRDDHMYDVVVVLGYNDDPIVAGKGSAIFLHILHDDGTPTAGCVALARDDLLAVLKLIDAASVIEIERA